MAILSQELIITNLQRGILLRDYLRYLGVLFNVLVFTFVSGCAVSMEQVDMGDDRVLSFDKIIGRQGSNWYTSEAVEVEAVTRSALSDSQDEQYHDAPVILRSSDILISQVHSGEITALAPFTDGYGVISGDISGKVILTVLDDPSRLDDDSSRPTRFKNTEIYDAGKPIAALSLSPDQRLLAIAYYSTLILYDLIDRTEISRMTRVSGRITALAWDPRGDYVAFGQANGDVFLWRKNAGQLSWMDSLRRLEAYVAATSPIVKLVFHPKGRSFFAAEKEGRIVLWRLVRTEEEIGLKNQQLNSEEKLEISAVKEEFAKLRTQIYDMNLAQGASEIHVAGTDGGLYRWKVRGLKFLKPVTVTKGSVFVVSEFSPVTLGSPFTYSLTASRDQRIKVWCSSGSLLGQSVLLHEPVSLLAVGARGTVVWGAQKGGHILVLDGRGGIKSLDFGLGCS